MRRAVVIAAVGAAIAVGVWALRRGESPRRPETTPASETATKASPTTVAASAPPVRVGRPTASGSRPMASAPSTTPDAPPSDVLASVREAKRVQSDATTAALVRALDEGDAPAKIEAIDELVKRKHVAALKPLMKVDPADDPYVGPTAMLGLGQLARDADPAQREAAVTRFAKLLEQEKARQGMDSPGNMLVIFEALGKIGTPSAAHLLEQELVDPVHPTAAKVAIVDALEACGQSSSVVALTAFRTKFQVSAQDEFEREIEQDLVKALDRAIATLSSKR